MPVGPFDPSVPVPGESGTTSTANTLPNGQYDIYNLGSLYNKTIYLGNSVTPVPGPGAGLPVPTLPQTQGETTAPVTSTPEEYIRQFAGMSVTDPQQYAALQQQLFMAGFYGSSKPMWGVYTPGDASAMKSAITGYLGIVNPNSPQPLTLPDYLDHAAAQGKKNAKSALAATPAPKLAVTDPAAIRAAAVSAFESATGKAPSKKQIEAFVTQFQQQQKQYELTKSGTASAPSLSSDAIAYAEQEDPQAYHQNQHDAYVNALVNMMAPSGSGRPSMTPVPDVTGG